MTPREPIPAHVQNALALDGTLATGRVTTKARPNRCRRCHAPTLAGIADVYGRVDVDLEPTTLLGELQALLDGRRTFTIAGGELVNRTQWRIAARDADTEPAHPEHRCGSPPSPVNPAHRPRITSRPDYDGPPPF